MDTVVETQNPILDKTAYAVPYTKYQRKEKGAEGSKNITMTNNGFADVEITIPGNNYLNLYETELQYTMMVPASGGANARYLLPADCITEIKSISVEFTDTSEKIVSIEDLPRYTKQHCAPKLNFRKRSLKDRIYFNSARTTNVAGTDPLAGDPYYQTVGNNGLAVEILNTHSNLIATGNAITPLVFNYKLRDILPDTFFEMDIAQKYNSPILIKMKFNMPNQAFLSKLDVTNPGVISTNAVAIGDTAVNNIKIGYYVVNVDETDSEAVLAKLANSTYSFYYPSPIISVLPVTGAGDQTIVSRVSSSQAITLYKLFATPFKHYSNAANSFLQANSSNIIGLNQKWDRVVMNDSSCCLELRPDNRTYHQFIKSQLGDNHSFTSDRSYENYGTVFYVYETASNPNTEYEQMMLKGKRVTEGTIESSFLFGILPNAGVGADADNTQDKYYNFISATVFKKGVYDRGNIKL